MKRLISKINKRTEQPRDRVAVFNDKCSEIGVLGREIGVWAQSVSDLPDWHRWNREQAHTGTGSGTSKVLFTIWT